MVKYILVANHHLMEAGGTETYTYAIAEELLKRGFEVEYFTFRRGGFAAQMEEKLQIGFMSRKKYDLILANHYTCVNYLFSKGFCVQTCHGIFPKKEQPSLFADYYVSISSEIEAHLKSKRKESTIILNGLNTARFRITNNINNKLTTVLSLCHSDEANSLLRQACDELGLIFREQSKFNNPIWNVQDLINSADLVVALGRSAYEAMACGRPVIVFDSRHYYHSCGDGYVKDILLDSIKFNCSGRFKNKKFTVDELKTELLKYRFEDGFFFRQFAVDNLNIHLNIEKYLALPERRISSYKKLYAVFFCFFVSYWFRLYYWFRYSVLK